MNYQQALQYMFDKLPMFQRVGVRAYKKDLTRTLELCAHLGNPQDRLKCIHVAGTNGKGSVSHMLASALQQNGYRTGLYISPHYRDFRERIKINGEYIGKRFISGFITRHRGIIEETEPSFFELTVALCLHYFDQQEVDYAVIETGLGGRLDSTNVIHPLLSVITNVSWDHMDVLGHTLSEIAREKAGIIKQGVPVVIGRKNEETDRVFTSRAAEENSGLVFAEDVPVRHEGDDLVFGGNARFRPDLAGPYQTENYRTAYAATKYLQDKKIIPLEMDRVMQAFGQVTKNTRLMGRWQWAGRNPDILLDSAHNEDGIRHFCNWLSQQDYAKVHLVTGFVKDKDLSTLLSLLPASAQYYFTQARIPRALDSSLLRQQAAAFHLKGKAYKRVRNAYKAAISAAASGDLVAVCGSIFVLAEII